MNIYNTETGAKYLGVSYRRVWNAANVCSIGFMIGRRRFFMAEDLERIKEYLKAIHEAMMPGERRAIENAKGVTK